MNDSLVRCTLRASLSGTFLQALPDLVMPLKGHSDLYLRPAVQRRGQGPPKGLGTNMTVETTYRPSTHVIVQELCESRGGCPGLSVLTSLLVSLDVKNY